MPSRRPRPEPTLLIFPDQVHIGDCFNDSATEDEAAEREIVSRPVTSVENEMNAMSKKEADAGVEGPMARRRSIELRPIKELHL